MQIKYMITHKHETTGEVHKKEFCSDPFQYDTMISKRN